MMEEEERQVQGGLQRLQSEQQEICAVLEEEFSSQTTA
jgi:hypothetical protein